MPHFVVPHQEMTGLWTRYMRGIRALGFSFVPKDHLMLHVNHRCPFTGNPWATATFLDESLNKQLKKALRLRHQSTFERLAFVKVQETINRHLGR
eukprot:1414228-Alexandrium_andersonii.AAC.1